MPVPVSDWLLASPVVAGAPISARRGLHSDERRSASSAELGRCTTAIRQATDLDGRLAAVAVHARRLTGAEHAELAYLDGPDHVLVHVDDGERHDRQRRRASEVDRRRLRMTSSAPDRAVVAKVGVVGTTHRRTQTGRRTAVSVALVEHGLVTGCLTVERGGRGLSRRQVDALLALAAAVGPVLEVRSELEDLAREGDRAATALAELDQAHEVLRRATSSRSLHVAMTSHELRAPLTALLAEAELLTRWIGDHDKVDTCRSLVDGVAQNADRLLRLVDDLVDLARIENGQIELRRRPVDLGEVADDVVRALLRVAEDDGVVLSLTVAGSARLEGDPGRLWQVVANLVQNAMRAAGRGGRVDVVVTGDAGGRADVEVHDTGPGMSDLELARVFAPFERGSVGGGGLGLGLAITRHLVERHGGQLTATSQVGVGTRFAARFADTVTTTSGARVDRPLTG